MCIRDSSCTEDEGTRDDAMATAVAAVAMASAALGVTDQLAGIEVFPLPLLA